MPNGVVKNSPVTGREATDDPWALALGTRHPASCEAVSPAGGEAPRVVGERGTGRAQRV